MSSPTALEQLSHDLTHAIQRAGASIVAIHARKRIPATGIVWSDDLVVATDHTIRRDAGITVTLDDGSTRDAVLVGRDGGTDLAVLRVAGGGLTPITRAPREALHVGQIALAVGRPGRDLTASMGVLSALGPEWRTWRGGKIDRFVRIDVAIYDGFSGGPSLDASGRLLGVNSSALARAAAVTIPVVTIERVVQAIVAGTASTRRGWLGIAAQGVRVPEATRTRLALAHDGGLLVINVSADSPAERGGMMLGDVIIAVAGTPTHDPRDILDVLASDTVGKTLTVRLVRGGELVELGVTIGEAPAQARR
ncbi:MAG: S1C family serine protease [Gemmatimonadaceae bacterium]|jgi:S1-C subfamily serine protease|nr:S1C family serine protease [Gemmatimonadaceae bacterium]